MGADSSGIVLSQCCRLRLMLDGPVLDKMPMAQHPTFIKQTRQWSVVPHLREPVITSVPGIVDLEQTRSL